jgi:hypothetical protein
MKNWHMSRSLTEHAGLAMVSAFVEAVPLSAVVNAPV